MKAKVPLFFLLIAAAIAFFIGRDTAPHRCPPNEQAEAQALRTKHITDSLRSAHIIDSLNAIIAHEDTNQIRFDAIDSLIDHNPKYRPHAYRDSATAAKLDFIRGADRR